jgi:hypothetical protein
VGTLGSAINKLGADTANTLGGGATFDPTTGAISAPTYTVGNNTYNNAGSAFAAISATLQQISGGSGLVQQSGGSHGAITVGAATGGSVINVAGTDGNRRMTGVAPGAITASSTDAVNGSQLYQLENALLSVPADVQRNAYGASASAIAQSGLPQSYEPGRSMVALGIGTIGGQSALALGASRITDNGRWVMKLNGSVSTTSKAGVGAGVGYQW